MSITIGTKGKSQFILELYRHSIFIRLPLIGQTHINKELGTHWDSWKTLTGKGEV